MTLITSALAFIASIAATILINALTFSAVMLSEGSIMASGAIEMKDISLASFDNANGAILGKVPSATQNKGSALATNASQNAVRALGFFQAAVNIAKLAKFSSAVGIILSLAQAFANGISL
jgi:hypothetical protein